MSQQWWGEYSLEEGGTRYWEIGPLRFWARRLQQEWRFASMAAGDHSDEHLNVAAPSPAEPDESAENIQFGFREAHPTLELGPACPDRLVVVKSDRELFVPPGEEISLFVSTGLWLQVRTGASPALLYEIPFRRPSDTWFGPSTLVGELCYSARVKVRFRLEDVVRRPHRAISVVKIRNRASTQLALTRLTLPVPLLSLYGSEDGQLWTESMTLIRDADGEHAEVKLGRGAPREAHGAKKLTGPRRQPQKGVLLRSFASLLRRDRGVEF
ncbi:MAG: hypothetical protein DHS20C21_13380 [Gemmatimonadota bacterium]|nr:MAG: hypothetical protein DHS20C21_13380 [Gemmatimonadota bacterium]